MSKTTKVLLGVDAIVAVIAAAAIVISLAMLSKRVSDNVANLRSSAYASCILLRQVIFATTMSGEHPVRQTQAVAAFIRTTPLKNCYTYAQIVAP